MATTFLAALSEDCVVTFSVLALTLTQFDRHVASSGANLENCVRLLNARLFHHGLDDLGILEDMLPIATRVEH